MASGKRQESMEENRWLSVFGSEATKNVSKLPQLSVVITVIAMWLSFLWPAASFSWPEDNLITDVPAEVLSFKHRKGDTYRILSKVHEDVYFNRRKTNHSEIVNRISVRVMDAAVDGTGTLDATFMTTENSTVDGAPHVFTYGEEFKSLFNRSATGRYAISDEYFMPVIRDNPIFPDKPVAPGDTWQAEGYEAEDFRRAFGMNKPFKVPFMAAYKFLGAATGEDGQQLFVIDVKYDLRYDSPPPPRGALSVDSIHQPARTQVFSHERLYWNNELGEVDHYVEDFRIEIETYYGDVYLFQGVAEAQSLKAPKTNTDANVKIVQGTLHDMGVKDVTVKQGEKGLTISLDRIQFLPDSAELLDSEKEKIQKIAKIISRYTNDILVTGHCALRGTEPEQQRISTQRAQSVADYLIKIKARDEYHIFTKGKGAAEPIAPNDTEDGRAQNRRVEITLMDE